MNRILLFIGTNIAILVVLSLVMQLLGIESLLNEQGTQLDLRSLLIFSAVIGFAGSFISLAISKWSAKRLTGAHVIKTPQNATEGLDTLNAASLLRAHLEMRQRGWIH